MLGSRATGRKYGFDRFWRDVRTHSVHDPVAYKRREVGRWALLDEVRILEHPEWEAELVSIILATDSGTDLVHMMFELSLSWQRPYSMIGLKRTRNVKNVQRSSALGVA